MKKYFIFQLFLLLSACSSEESDSRKKKQPIYLDAAASWNISNPSLAEFIEVSQLNGNSSGINAHAKYLKKLEEQSSKIIADKICALPEQIHFTSGATAANNIAILGVAYKNPKCHLITSKIEHKSVLNVFKHLEKIGYKVTYLDVDKHGNVNLNQLRKCIQNDTKLISIQMFNSEIGTLQNVREIGRIANKHRVLFHVDAAQSFCKYDIDVNAMNVDFLTLSGHKIGAPKGIGAVYVRDASKIQPIMFGSGDDLCPGTKPTALICDFAKAVERFRIDHKRIKTNFGLFVAELLQIEKIYINSINASHIVSVSISGVLLRDILERIKEYSFSAGCSCLGQDRSNVMEAIDPEDKLPSCTIRISFSDKTKKEQLVDFAKKLKIAVEQLREEKKVKKGCESLPSDNSEKHLSNSLDKIQELMEKENPKKTKGKDLLISTDFVDKYVQK